MAMTYLLKINGAEITKVRKYKVGRNKLWTEAKRNMSGDLRSTFTGLFPKISLEIGYLTASELHTVMGLLDTPSLTISYWDENSQSYKSGTYYASDYEVSYFLVDKALYEPFTVNLVPFNKV